MRYPCSPGLAIVAGLALLLAGCGSSSSPPPASPVEPFVGHEAYFTENAYEGPESCLACHETETSEVMASAHWNWKGQATNIVGHENGIHGKVDLINNFCIAIASNEGRCTQCHVGYGWVDASFDFDDPLLVDCLICHDTTGLYKKAKPNGGMPSTSIEDLQLVARGVGEPSRNNCGACHYFAGGGDNVKHGDLASTLNDPLPAEDVHMATTGRNMSCQECHTTMNHKIAGMPLHSTNEGAMDCTDCHASPTLHADMGGSATYDAHMDKIACQTCHIPTFSRSMPTKVFWDWSTAGQDMDPIPTDEFGKPTYDKMKGTFEWDMFVEPELRWYDGKWSRLIVGVDDQRANDTVVLAEPVATIDTPGAKIYPFKLMRGAQPRDMVNKTMLVPHLFGQTGGANPYWGTWDWDLALEEGAAAAGQVYTGMYEWVPTRMYLTINHEIAPKAEARTCFDCHNGGIKWGNLGYNGDPMFQ